MESLKLEELVADLNTGTGRPTDGQEVMANQSARVAAVPVMGQEVEVVSIRSIYTGSNLSDDYLPNGQQDTA